MKKLLLIFIILISSSVFANEIGTVKLSYLKSENIIEEKTQGFDHHLYIGCRYSGDVKNETIYPVVSNHLKFKGYLSGEWISSFKSLNTLTGSRADDVLQPNSSYQLTFAWITRYIQDSKFTSDQITEKLSIMGCEGQSQNGMIEIVGANVLSGPDAVVIFSPSSGIEPSNKYYSVEEGSFPVEITLSAKMSI